MKILFQWIQKFIFPHLCSVCCKSTVDDHGSVVCASCATDFTVPNEPVCKLCGGEVDTVLDCCSECLEGKLLWQRGVTLWKYEGAARDAIHRYKYRGDLALAGFFAKEMAKKFPIDGISVDAVLTWIPLHPLKKFIRGYNQSEVLAKRLSALINHPCKKLIDRVKCTRQQAMLDRDGRRKNMKNAFKLNRKNGYLVKGVDVILLDDVLTTGSTLNEAARILINNGAQSVTVISIARG